MTVKTSVLNVSIAGVKPAMPVIGPKAESTERGSVVRLSDTTAFAGAAEVAAILPRNKGCGYLPRLFC